MVLNIKDNIFIHLVFSNVNFMEYFAVNHLAHESD